jgi:hypothetical protein
LIVDKSNHEGPLAGYLYALALALAAKLSVVTTSVNLFLAITVVGLDDFWQKLNLI